MYFHSTRKVSSTYFQENALGPIVALNEYPKRTLSMDIYQETLNHVESCEYILIVPRE